MPTTLLQAQLAALRADLNRLVDILDAFDAPGAPTALMASRFKRFIHPLAHQLETAVQPLLDGGDVAAAWEALLARQAQSRLLMQEALAYLGGLSIRSAGLDGGLAEVAGALADHYAQQAGVMWSPSVLVGGGAAGDWPEAVVVDQNPGDTLLPLPIPRWDVWYLPLLAGEFGYAVAKRGELDGLDQFVAEQVARVSTLLDDPPPADAEVAPLLPEVRRIWEARLHADDADAFRATYRPILHDLALRQQVHLWRLAADALAAYLAGPAYAYALLFLVADPTRPDREGADAEGSRYQPADARRLAVVLGVLGAVNEAARPDEHTPGPYHADLGLLTSVWEGALALAGTLAGYQQVRAAMAGWTQRLHDELVVALGLQGRDTVARWQNAVAGLVPILRDGAGAPAQPDLPSLIDAAWWCRARYPERIEDLTRDCARLLAGDHPPRGLNAPPPAYANAAERLLHSRLYDLAIDLDRLAEIFHAGAIDRADRDAVAGRFYRLLSEQQYGLRQVRKLAAMGAPLSATLPDVVRRSRAPEMHEIRREMLDFLGGVLMRKKGVDDGYGDLAEAILRHHARQTGVNWASRAVLGANPLFSPMSDMVHARFVDWDVWNLPLMSHEFGHVAAFATPAFLSLLAGESGKAAQGHPRAGDWSEAETRAYVERWGRHVHEFFADAFAVYCLGPAFAYDMILLHLHPPEAHLPRGDHPSHAERVDVILGVLEEMNKSEKTDEFDAGPYASALARLKSWWDRPAPDDVATFHQIKARTLAGQIYRLLETYYRLGAQYQADDWKRARDLAGTLLAHDPDLSGETLRDLLNVAWACRVRHPDRVRDISRIIRPACKQRLGLP